MAVKGVLEVVRALMSYTEQREKMRPEHLPRRKCVFKPLGLGKTQTAAVPILCSCGPSAAFPPGNECQSSVHVMPRVAGVDGALGRTGRGVDL